MTAKGDLEIFLATAPGLESVLCEEARAKGFKAARATTPATATTEAVINAALLRRANFRNRYHADGGHASTGSSCK